MLGDTKLESQDRDARGLGEEEEVDTPEEAEALMDNEAAEAGDTTPEADADAEETNRKT